MPLGEGRGWERREEGGFFDDATLLVATVFIYLDCARLRTAWRG